MTEQTKTIVTEIDKLADSKKADWWKNYLKNPVSFIGVGIPQIRDILIKTRKKHLFPAGK